MENVKDKVIIITGASSGIGAEAAKKLINLGAKVVLSARREDKLITITEGLGENAMYVVTDVRKRGDLDRLAKQTIERFGQIDILWNNAGIMPVSFFDEGLVEEWDEMIDVNIKGVLYGINAVLPHMLQRKTGHIIATSSIAGLRTNSGTGVYCGTKFAVRAIMDSLRQELVQSIRVTTIYPGATSSELVNTITSQKVKDLYMSNPTPPPVMDGEAIADAFIYAISQPRSVVVNDIVVRPLGQTR